MHNFIAYRRLRALGVRPALAYRLAWMEQPRTPIELTLMLTARAEVV